MIHLELQHIIIFSDGTLSLSLTNKTQKIVNCLDKDLKEFQKNSYKKSVTTLTKLNKITNYRKQLFNK